MRDPEEILAFWFEQPAPDAETLKRKIRRWYGGGPALDAEIASRFGAYVERAQRAELAAWSGSARPCLAGILLMDQFTRSTYRGTGRAFAQDGDARQWSLAGIAAGFERELTLDERMFLYMPLVHAEDVALQDRAVRCMQSIVDAAPEALRAVYGTALGSALQHQDTIRRFGRFPARNVALGRASTPEEHAFLGA